jgi:hypothetical protein
MTTTDSTNNQNPAATTPDTSQQSSQQTSAEQTTEQGKQTPSDSGSTDLGGEDSAASGSDKKDEGSSDTTDLGAEDEKEEDKAPKYFGAPENGAYADPTLPDGVVAHPELKSQFDPIAAELGLNQEGYQKLVDFYAREKQNELQTWGNHLKELKTSAQADPEIGGKNYDQNIAIARKVISKYGTPAFRQMLNGYGVGAHPEMIRMLVKFGQATGETPTVTDSGDAGGVVKDKPLHEILYK